MGLHTGEPRLSEEGYVGLDVHKGHGSPRLARTAEAVSLELLALSGIGACVAQDPVQQERAAVTLTFAMGHEQLPPSYARAARPALERLEEELPPEQLAATRDAAARASLHDLIEEALAAAPAVTPAVRV